MRNNIIRYAGIALLVIGVGILSYHFINNYIVARNETKILTAWESVVVESIPTADTGETTEEIIEEENNIDGTEEIPKVIDPEKKLPFRITIPKIDVDWIVDEGTDFATLREGPGFYISSTLPGEIGSTVICGHRTTYGAPFNRLDELEAGDEIILETKGNEIFVYLVTEQIEVQPTDMSVLENTDYPSLVLSTCTPKFFSTRRLIIFARLEE